MRVAWGDTLKKMLSIIRSVHTAIFLVMACSVMFILASGAFALRSPAVYIAILLIGVEGLVFIGNGRTCPLTSLAKRYGAEKGYVFDTWFPERLTRYTFPVFTSLLVLGLVLCWIRRVI